MDGRTRREAVERCLAEARQVAGCVTDQPLRTVTDARLGFAFRLDVTTAAGPDSHGYRVVPVSYGYRLSDRSGHELLAYHWHPNGLSSVVRPHVHLSGRVRAVPLEPNDGVLDLAGLHLPTGHVTLADVVRFLIAEVGVAPRRSDWETVLGPASD